MVAPIRRTSGFAKTILQATKPAKLEELTEAPILKPKSQPIIIDPQKNKKFNLSEFLSKLYKKFTKTPDLKPREALGESAGGSN